MWRPTGASMARPRSLAGITSLVTGGDGMPPNSSALASPSPTIAALQVAAGPPAATLAPAGTGESSPLYSGAKVQDASLLKLLRGHCLRIRHRLRSAASGGVNGSAGMYSVALLLLLALWALYARTAAYAAAPRHLVVLDAGSTGTRAHVFTYAATTRSSSYAAMQLPEPKLKTSPGLSSFAREPAGAVASLAPLLQFAASHVPPHLRSSTPVLLMATAGLRLLPDTEAQALLNACRGVLAASGFAFRREWASIISGADEGLFAWVAANYASGALQAAARNLRSRKDPRPQGRDGHHFHALLELGGASAQVTFMPDGRSWRSSSSSSSNSNASSDDSSTAADGTISVKLPGVSRPLWSHSYLGYGFDVVAAKVDALVLEQAGGRTRNGSTTSAAAAAAVPDPCLPAGYPAQDGRIGSGDWTECRALVARAIDPAHCRAAAAHGGTSCPQLPKAMPRLSGELLAVENFAFTAAALGMAQRSSVGELGAAARRFCSRPWPQTAAAAEAARTPETAPEYLWRYCFGATFAWTLLHDVLHIGEGAAVTFTNSLHAPHGGELIGLDWALGAAVLQLSARGGDAGTALVAARRRETALLVAALLGSVALAGAAARALVLALTTPRGDVVSSTANGLNSAAYKPLPVLLTSRISE